MCSRFPVASLVVAVLFWLASPALGNWLDAETGRWLSRDPGGAPDTTNLYACASAQPISPRSSLEETISPSGAPAVYEVGDAPEMLMSASGPSCPCPTASQGTDFPAAQTHGPCDITSACDKPNTRSGACVNTKANCLFYWPWSPIEYYACLNFGNGPVQNCIRGCLQRCALANCWRDNTTRFILCHGECISACNGSGTIPY